jgi:hypothetical protein
LCFAHLLKWWSGITLGFSPGDAGSSPAFSFLVHLDLLNFIVKTGNTGRKRTADQIKNDRLVVARLYLQGKTQREIAEVISEQYDFTITHQIISVELKEIQAIWLKDSIRGFDEIKAQELAKLDLIEAQLWASWEALIEAKKFTPNPALLAEIGRCVDRRLKIFGLDAMLKAEDLDVSIASVVRAGYQVSIPAHGSESAEVVG